MNVALCLSGLPRNLENSYFWLKKSLLDVFDNNNIQYSFFISFWDNIKDNKTLDLFNPAALEIEKWDDEKIKELNWNQYKKYDGANPNFVGMYYKIFKCNNLRLLYEQQNNIKYDAVFRLRTELRFNNEFNIDELNNLNEGIMLHLIENPLHLWTRDTLAFGNSDNMNVYSNLYTKLLELNQTRRCSTPELLLQYWLEMNKITCKNTSLSYNIIRK